MPLREGWSPEIVHQNVAEMCGSGKYTQAQAVAASLGSARRAYRARHPRGPFPHHLKQTRRSRSNNMARQQKNTPPGGDYRYDYVPFDRLSPRDQSAARGRYPHKMSHLPDEAYLYPVKKDGTLANATRWISNEVAARLWEEAGRPQVQKTIGQNRAGRSSRSRSVCRCPAYEFPHKAGSGSCGTMNRAHGQLHTMFPGIVTYSTRYVHAIHPSEADVGPDVVLRAADVADRKKLGAALRNARVLHSGAQVREYRFENDDRLIVFPRMPGMTTYWHSVILTPRI